MTESLKNKIQYTDEPLGEVRIVEDFLPSPEELAYREENIKITIAHSSSSVKFFKAEAKKSGVPYQRMIRRLLDDYARLHMH